MKYIEDYLFYNSGNECPKQYHLWTALFLLASTLGRKVVLRNGYFITKPNLYVGLIGEQGNRKSTAKDIGRELFTEVFPTAPVAAESMTREAIYKLLASDETERCYTDTDEAPVLWHPYTLFINELKHFLSVNPSGMIEFLTNIYDREFFDVVTKNQGSDRIEKPCLNFLFCETPEWLVEKLKTNIISGGFARRVVYIMETEEPGRIPFPEITPSMQDAWERVKSHLLGIEDVVGEMQWTPKARSLYETWYKELKLPDDPIMRGYYRSKHIQLQKLCIAVSMADPNYKMEITPETLDISLGILDRAETNMPKLSIAAGRNDLAVPQQKILDMLHRAGGWMTQRKLLKLSGKDLSPFEQNQVLDFLKRTEQIAPAVAKFNGGKRDIYYLCSEIERLRTDGLFSTSSADSPPSATHPSHNDETN